MVSAFGATVRIPPRSWRRDMKMKKSAVLAGLVFVALLSGCYVVDPGPVGPTPTAGSVTVQNMSSYTIMNLYMSSSADPNWGNDQLGDQTIPANGGTFILNNVPCGTYDIKTVDEDQDECQMMGVQLCGDHVWQITNEELLQCEGYAQK
jgi:hypothetical protein